MTMKRFAAFVLGVVFLSMLFVVPAIAATVKVTMRTLPATAGQKFLKKAVKRFKKKTGIKIKLELVSSGVVRRRLITAAETKAGSDIIIAQFNGAVTIANALEDVDDIVEPYAKKYGVLPLFKDAGFIKGHWKAVPFVNISQLITYRKDILKKIGENPPDTWEDALRVGKKLKAAGLPPWAEALGSHPIDPSSTVLNILWGYGSRQVSPDGKKITIDSAETRAGLKFIKKAFNEAWPKAVLQWTAVENNQTFIAGKISMTTNSPSIAWKANSKKKWAKLASNTGLAPIPRGPSGRHSTTIPLSWVLFKHSKVKKEAKEFLKFMMEPEQQVGYSAGAWMAVPAFIEMAKDLPDAPHYRAMAEQAKFSHMPGWPGPASRAGVETHERFVLLNMAQRYVQGEDLDTTIKKTVKELRRIYGVN